MDWALIIGGLLIALLVVYALTGGADFGGGVWDLLASGPRASSQRALIDRAIGPVWEANHVWLIAMIVVMFIAFPKVFALFATALHLPLTLMLFGIIVRGSAFVFRHYDPDHAKRWSRLFAISSVAAPLMLGLCLGALSSGGMVLNEAGEPAANFVAAWWRPLPWAAAALGLAMVAMLAALYLTRETDDTALREDFRRRALWSTVAVITLASLAYAVARHDAPYLAAGLTGRSAWATALFAIGILSGAIVIVALVRKSLVIARFAGAGFTVTILLGWAAAMFPYLIWPTYTAQDAAAPDNILRLTFWIFIAGSTLLVPSLYLLFKVFKFAPKT